MKSLRTPRARTLGLLVLAGAVWLTACFVCALNERPWFPPSVISLLHSVELALYDKRMEWRPPHAIDARVAVVEIDQESEEELGAFPWSRRKHADLIRRLTAGGALAIGFDVGFGSRSKEDPGADRALADAIRASGRVVVTHYQQRDKHGKLARSVQELPPEVDAALGPSAKGKTVLLTDDDNGYRAVPLNPPDFPALDVRMLEKLTGQPGLFYVPGVSPQSRFAVGDYSVPVWRRPNLLFVDFPGTPIQARYSYHKVLQGQSGDFQGKIVLVGSTLDVNDAYRVPRNEAGVPSEQPDFSGVMVHACILDNMLRGQAIVRPEYPLEPASADPWIGGATVGLGLCLLSLLAHHFLRLTRGLAASAALGLFYGVANFALFRATGLYLNLVLPSSMLFFFNLGVLLLDTRRVRQVLKRFVPDQHVEGLLHSPELLESAHTTQEATVLFVDIRDYTTLSEKLGDPGQVRAMVGRFHRDLAQVFESFGGYVCDFQGDAQMVAFGVSPPNAEHFRQAVKAAQALPAKVEELNEALAVEYPGVDPFRYGVGICTGPVSLGYLQGGGKLQHTVLGDTTNTAARLQNAARDLGVIAVVSHTTADRLWDGEFMLRELPPISLKGKAEPHRIFELARL